MKSVPILNIKQFENKTVLKDVYCNALDVHLKSNANIIHKSNDQNDPYPCVSISLADSVQSQCQPGLAQDGVRSGPDYSLAQEQNQCHKLSAQRKGH